MSIEIVKQESRYAVRAYFAPVVWLVRGIVWVFRRRHQTREVLPLHKPHTIKSPTAIAPKELPPTPTGKPAPTA